MDIVRKITVEDFQKLHIEAGWKILDDKEIKLSLKNSMFVSCATLENMVVGIARVVGDNATHGLLCDVIVHPEFQGKGIGKALVQDIMAQAQAFADKHDEFMLEVLPVEGKEEFYKKCGLKVDPSKMAGAYKWFKNHNKYTDTTKKHVSHLNPGPFNIIKAGIKTVELRVNDEKRRTFKVDDILIFVNRNTDERLWTKITKLNYADTFASLYKDYAPIAMGYNKDQTPDPEDMAIYYPIEEQLKYGVVGIEIELIK